MNNTRRELKVSTIPLTKNPASVTQQQQLRQSIKNTTGIPGIAHVANQADINELTALLIDPKVSTPIYTLPPIISLQTITEFVVDHLSEREQGQGLLMISTDNSGIASAYYDIQFWPQWNACELGGAMRPDMQNSGQGSRGAATVFDWLFDIIGIDLICETAGLDNIRTSRLLESIGFKFKGEISSSLANGKQRPSNYWELSKSDWHLLVHNKNNQ